LTAYHFVNNQANWRAIASLAEHILDDDSASYISCEKINSLLQTYLESETKMGVLSWPIREPMAMGRNHLAVTIHGG
jgi:hypothetical protein